VQNTGGRPQWACSTWNVHLVRHVFHVKHRAGFILCRRTLRAHPPSYLGGTPAGTHACAVACGRGMSARQPTPRPHASRADLLGSHECKRTPTHRSDNARRLPTTDIEPHNSLPPCAQQHHGDSARPADSLEREGYFPMQNLRKISPNSSSAVLRPEISSSAYSA
jgi:hypothetical protein